MGNTVCGWPCTHAECNGNTYSSLILMTGLTHNFFLKQLPNEWKILIHQSLALQGRSEERGTPSPLSTQRGRWPLVGRERVWFNGLFVARAEPLGMGHVIRIYIHLIHVIYVYLHSNALLAHNYRCYANNCRSPIAHRAMEGRSRQVLSTLLHQRFFH